jgi:chorismate mutase
MAALPENLAELEPVELRNAAQARDEKIEPLFRRWPRLTRNELVELAQLYRERMRVAKQVARRRGVSDLV